MKQTRIVTAIGLAIASLSFLVFNSFPAEAQEIKTEPLYSFLSSKGYRLYKLGQNLPPGLSDGPWKNEGIVAYVLPNSLPGAHAVYSLVKADEYGTRFAYTKNKNETGGGWSMQGVAFYVMSADTPETVTLYKLYAPARETNPGEAFSAMVQGTDAVFLTTNRSERQKALAAGWVDHGRLGFVFTSPPKAPMLPDLSVQQVNAEEYSVNAVVVNNGKANTGSADLYAHLMIYDASGKVIFSDGRFVGGLSPGQSRPVKFETGNRSLHLKSYRVRVDLSNLVTESNENNNESALTEFRRKLKINTPADSGLKLPTPSISLTHKQAAAPKGSRQQTAYKVAVHNWEKYPADWFQSTKGALSPGPCGDARLQAIVNIMRNGEQAKVSCEALNSPADLRSIDFVTVNLKDDDQISITIVDRLSNETRVSEAYTVGWFGVAGLLKTMGCQSFLGRASQYLCRTSEGYNACENLRKQGKPIECRRAGVAQ